MTKSLLFAFSLSFITICGLASEWDIDPFYETLNSLEELSSFYQELEKNSSADAPLELRYTVELENLLRSNDPTKENKIYRIVRYLLLNHNLSQDLLLTVLLQSQRSYLLKDSSLTKYLNTPFLWDTLYDVISEIEEDYITTESDSAYYILLEKFLRFIPQKAFCDSPSKLLMNAWDLGKDYHALEQYCSKHVTKDNKQLLWHCWLSARDYNALFRYAVILAEEKIESVGTIKDLYWKCWKEAGMYDALFNYTMEEFRSNSDNPNVKKMFLKIWKERLDFRTLPYLADLELDHDKKLEYLKKSWEDGLNYRSLFLFNKILWKGEKGVECSEDIRKQFEICWETNKDYDAAHALAGMLWKGQGGHSDVEKAKVLFLECWKVSANEESLKNYTQILQDEGSVGPDVAVAQRILKVLELRHKTCSLCSKNFDDEGSYSTKCQHKFHLDCFLNHLLTESTKCPDCSCKI